jgi:hypothetical protein
VLYLFVATVYRSDIRVHRFRLPLIPYLIINFVETAVAAEVSLLTGVHGSSLPKQEELLLMADYPLHVFVSDDNVVAIASPPAIAPGGTLQVCLKHDEVNFDLQVESIYSATLRQPCEPQQQNDGTV